ncbi:MAG: HAMP domain-containing histidine kinase [Bacteroidia bacterium]|nr:HAMP domain-containing histidine kinase [Bacteroidia bacterium]
MRKTRQEISSTKNNAILHINEAELLSAGHIGAGIAYWNNTGECLISNNIYAEIYNREVSDIKGINIKTLLGADYQTQIKYINDALNGIVCVSKDEHLSPNGEIKTILTTYTPDIADNVVKGFFIHISDVSVITKNLQTLKDENEAAVTRVKQQNIQLADFANITSHNLRSPASNLTALLGLHNESKNEEERKELFSHFETVVSHLNDTLNDLMETLKIKGQAEAETVTVSFEKVLTKTKEIISGEIIETKTVITSDFSNGSEIVYNKSYLESIMLNLVSNAIRYRSPERPPMIHISTAIDKGSLILSVKDNGLGINMEKYGHKLFGLHKTFHRNKDAKGVGLFITKTQVEAMGGSVIAMSEENTGSTFTINFNTSI